MGRYFNTTGSCNPRIHYMVDIRERLFEIKKMVDDGKYFTINRARQYGKTTTLMALADYLSKDYIVLSLDFQMIGTSKFSTEHAFSVAFANYLIRIVNSKIKPVAGIDRSILESLCKSSKENELFALDDLFPYLSDLCYTANKPVVLIIDEVDNATNNQVFLDFLSQLRGYYLNRLKMPTFHSVILAGVYDIKNIKRKIHPDEEYRINSPWNIAADFKVNMSFSENGIAGMLRDYESDNHTGMNISQMSELIYEYTSGYPFLVSRLCKLIDEDISGNGSFADPGSAWTKKGFLEAVRRLLFEKNALFESLIGKLLSYPQLERKLYSILFGGKWTAFNPDDSALDIAQMFGFIKNVNGAIAISNRIFETRLYNYFLSTDEAHESNIYVQAAGNKNQFICNGHLNMELVLKKFVEYFDSIYGEHPEEFDEEEGRRRFLLFLRPIINGTGNYYIEAQTRNARRMDVVVDYGGEQFIIELKIWRGNAYHERGEQQLADYLDYFHLKKGYMLSYNFNKKKCSGVKTIEIENRLLIEAVV